METRMIRAVQPPFVKNNNIVAPTPVVIGSTWIHRNGAKYIVTLIANSESTQDQYPVTVVYKGENGSVWTRPLSDWHRSLFPLPFGFFWTDKHIVQIQSMFMVNGQYAEFVTVEDARMAIINNPHWTF